MTVVSWLLKSPTRGTVRVAALEWLIEADCECTDFGVVELWV